MTAKTDAARLVTWRPDLRAHFERLNLEWIERWFVVEGEARKVFADPGGRIAPTRGRSVRARQLEADRVPPDGHDRAHQTADGGGGVGKRA